MDANGPDDTVTQAGRRPYRVRGRRIGRTGAGRRGRRAKIGPAVPAYRTNGCGSGVGAAAAVHAARKAITAGTRMRRFRTSPTRRNRLWLNAAHPPPATASGAATQYVTPQVKHPSTRQAPA